MSGGRSYLTTLIQNASKDVNIRRRAIIAAQKVHIISHAFMHDDGLAKKCRRPYVRPYIAKYTHPPPNPNRATPPVSSLVT